MCHVVYECAQWLLLFVAHPGGFLFWSTHYTHDETLNGVRFWKNVLHLWGLSGRWEKTEQSVRPRRDRAPPIEFCVCVCWSCSALGHLSSRLAAAPRWKKERRARFSQPETIITVTRVFLCDWISLARRCHSTTLRGSPSGLLVICLSSAHRDNPRTNSSMHFAAQRANWFDSAWNGPRSIADCVASQTCICSFYETNWLTKFIRVTQHAALFLHFCPSADRTLTLLQISLNLCAIYFRNFKTAFYFVFCLILEFYEHLKSSSSV